MSGLVLPFRGVTPTLAKDTFIAHTATVIGNTTIGSKSTVWYNTVLRGDVATITIGDNTNLQDGTIVHVTENQFDTHIGSNVVVGHRVILHGCTVEDWSFIAMDAVLLDGSHVESGGMLAAGALLTPGKRVPAGEIWAGRPARFWRKVTPEERSHWAPLIKHYVDLGQEYMAEDAGRRIAAK